MPRNSSSRRVRLSSTGVSTNSPRDATRGSTMGTLRVDRPIVSRMNVAIKRAKTNNRFRNFLIAAIEFVQLRADMLYALFLGGTVVPFLIAFRNKRDALPPATFAGISVEIRVSTAFHTH